MLNISRFGWRVLVRRVIHTFFFSLFIYHDANDKMHCRGLARSRLSKELEYCCYDVHIVFLFVFIGKINCACAKPKFADLAKLTWV